MKKRLLSIVTAAALVLTVLCSVVGTVSAAEGDSAGVNFTVSTSLQSAFAPAIKQGDTVTYYVSMSGATEVAALQVKLKYDDTVLKAESGEEQGVLVSMDGDFKTVNTAPVNAPGEVWITGMAKDNQPATSGGDIAKITFTALKDITADSPISVYYGKVCIVNTNEDGTVSVESLPEGNYTSGGVVFKGDVNKDGYVNTVDALSVLQHYVEPYLDEEAVQQADVDGNSIVNTVDALQILQSYVNG